MQQAILTVWAMSLAVVGAQSDELWQPVGLGGSGGMFALAVSPLDPQLMMVTDQWAQGDIPQYRFIATTDRNPLRVHVYCTGTSYWPARPKKIILTTFGSSILLGPAEP